MSHWRWTRISAAETALLPLVLTLLAVPAAHGAPPQAAAADAPGISTGPASPEEASLLWVDGQADIAEGRYEEGIHKLERFIARYPGYPGYIDAHWLLARAYLKTGKPAQAKPLLKDYVLAQGAKQDGIEARLDLGRAQLELSQPSEALLTSEEIVRLAGRKHPELQSRGLILKSRALIALNRDSRAVSAVESARKTLPENAKPALRGELIGVRQELKLRSCAKFPSGGRLDEAQVRDQLGRRGSCLLDSLLIFREALLQGDSASAKDSTGRLIQGYRSYLDACGHPPAPPATKPKDRSARQKEAYFRELGLVLKEECHQKTRQGLDLLRTWSSTPTPAPGANADALKQAAAELEKLL